MIPTPKPQAKTIHINQPAVDPPLPPLKPPELALVLLLLLALVILLLILSPHALPSNTPSTSLASPLDVVFLLEPTPEPVRSTLNLPSVAAAIGLKLRLTLAPLFAEPAKLPPSTPNTSSNSSTGLGGALLDALERYGDSVGLICRLLWLWKLFFVGLMPGLVGL